MDEQYMLKAVHRRHNEERQRCSQIMHAIQKRSDREMIRREIMAFWNSNLKQHIEAEESVVIPFLVKKDFNSEYINVLRREHDTIRVLAQRIPLHNDGYYFYKAFISLVDQHIRFEEEVVLRNVRMNGGV